MGNVFFLSGLVAGAWRLFGTCVVCYFLESNLLLWLIEEKVVGENWIYYVKMPSI